MIKKIILISLILSLVLVGCKKVEQPSPPAEAEDVSIESDMSEIDSLTKDLDTGDMENVEAELDEVNW